MSKATYARNMRANFRGFWSGAFGYDDFIYFMTSTIRAGLRNAFETGMKKAGIDDPGAITPDEVIQRENLIYNEINRVGGAAAWLEAHTKAKGFLWAAAQSRSDGWVPRWDEMYNLGYLLGLKDKPQEWFLGATEKHCDDCSNYAGRVYRASIWAKYDIRPQSTRLQCFGRWCDCRLGDTDKPLTRGYPPRPSRG